MHDRADYAPATASRAMGDIRPREVVAVPEGSWGEGGYHYIWLNDGTSWTWAHVYEHEVAFCEAVEKWSDSDEPDVQRLLKQCARELLLLESSDWQFLISTISAADYAQLRFTDHSERLARLMDLLQLRATGGKLEDGDWLFVEDCESKDSLFEDVDPKAWLPDDSTG